MKPKLSPEAPSQPYSDDAELRRRAEEHLHSQTQQDEGSLSGLEAQKLLHELQVHQIELEMQNEELRNAQFTAETAAAHYIELYDFSSMGLVSLTSKKTICQINLAGARLLGSERARLKGVRFNLFVTQADRPAFNDFLQQVFASEAKQTCEVVLARKLESYVEAENQPLCTVQLEATRSVDGQECRLVLVDVTERKQSEEQLKLAASVFTHAHEGIMITDVTGTIIEVNNTFTSITGYSREEALGHNPLICQSSHQKPDIYAAIRKSLLEKKHWHGELWNHRKDGEVIVIELMISTVCDARNRAQNHIAFFTDITSIKEHQHQLEHIAHYDVLTNLPNRALLADRLRLAMIQSERRKQSLAVAYLDLDGFKAINDTHGHEVGDKLLIALSQRMKESLRDGDTLARIGGDEFVAVMVDIQKLTDHEPVLTRLLQAAAAPITIGNAILQVSASIGVTLYPQDGAGAGANADQLMRHADQAMYVAKQTGKNCYHLFDVHQDTAVKTQRESLDAIQRALDYREFVLYYQPKVNMNTGEVIGAEALIRWQHPERGLVPPGDFLPSIENHPISIKLGEWVIDTALTQMAEWHTAGLVIPVSVNVSARQLSQQGFVTKLSAALAKYPEVKPCWLELEILETSALEDISEVSAIIHTCLEMGVSFALDDFGTGFSSLTYLKRLPAELLKIDRSFVRDMLDDSDDRAIVKGVIGLAAAFHRQVIAEGVETIAHGTQLLTMGCVLAQGYGIARPMPAAEMPTWIATWCPDEAWKA